MRLFWLIVGFAIGVAAARNARPMPVPVIGAVVLALALYSWLAWKAVNRDRASAIATAVATAVAQANAVAEAKAEAAAQAAAVAAVQVNVGAQGVDPAGRRQAPAPAPAASTCALVVRALVDNPLSQLRDVCGRPAGGSVYAREGDGPWLPVPHCADHESELAGQLVKVGCEVRSGRSPLALPVGANGYTPGV